MELCAVTVVGSARSVDLELPAFLPVAEWLGRAVELCEGGAAGGAVSSAWTLRLTGGEPLSPGETLADRGVTDGSILLLEARGRASVSPAPPSAAPAPPPSAVTPGPEAGPRFDDRRAAIVLAVSGSLVLLTAGVVPALTGAGLSAGAAAAACLAIAVAGVVAAGVAAATGAPRALQEALALPASPLAALATDVALEPHTSTTAAQLAGLGAAAAVGALLARTRLSWAGAGAAVAAALLAGLLVVHQVVARASFLYLDAVVCAGVVAGLAHAAPVAGRLRALLDGAAGGDPGTAGGRAGARRPEGRQAQGDPEASDGARAGVVAWASAVLVLGLGTLALGSDDPFTVGAAALIGAVAVREAARFPRLPEGAGLAVAGSIGVVAAGTAGTARLAGGGQLGAALATGLGGACLLVLLSAAARRLPAWRVAS